MPVVKAWRSAFNAGDNTSNAALAPATGFNAPASTQNLSGGLTVTGNGLLDLSGTNNYGGPTRISAGTLELDVNGNNLPTATALSIANGGVLDMGGVPQTVGSLSGSAGAVITSRYSGEIPTLTVASSAGSTTFAGNVISNVALAVSGSGAIDPQRHEHVHRRDDGQRRDARHRRPERIVRQRVGDDRRRRAAGFGQRRGHRRAACGLVAGQFERGCLECGGVDSGNDRRIWKHIWEHGDARRRSPTVARRWGNAVGGTAAAVPEPGTLALLAIGGLMLAAARWQRRG